MDDSAPFGLESGELDERMIWAGKALDALSQGVFLYTDSGHILYMNTVAIQTFVVDDDSDIFPKIQSIFLDPPFIGKGRTSLHIKTKVTFRTLPPETLFNYSLSKFIDPGGNDSQMIHVLLVEKFKLQQSEKSENEDSNSLLGRNHPAGTNNPLVWISQLLPKIAHEIKNPLACIQSMAELLEEELEAMPQVHEVRLILQELLRLRFIIDRMILANQDLRDIHYQSDMVEVVQRVLKLTHSRATLLGVEIHFGEVEPIIAALHPQLFHMALLNLINNALEACRSGGLIFVSIGVDNDDFWLSIVDTGCGMSPEVMENATKPFFSTKKAASLFSTNLWLLRVALLRPTLGRERVWRSILDELWVFLVHQFRAFLRILLGYWLREDNRVLVVDLGEFLVCSLRDESPIF